MTPLKQHGAAYRHPMRSPI